MIREWKFFEYIIFMCKNLHLIFTKETNNINVVILFIAIIIIANPTATILIYIDYSCHFLPSFSFQNQTILHQDGVLIFISHVVNMHTKKKVLVLIW